MDFSLGTGQGGDTVYVADASGHEIKGKLAALSTETLMLQGGTTFLEHDVTQIRVERQAPPWRGALIGLAAVGGPGLAACAADDDWCDYGEVGSENLFRRIAIFTTATGAVVGGLVDRSIKEKTIVFRSPSRRAVLAGISPLLALGRAGIQMSTRF